MKGHRYKARGWYGESHRHYLAAKGIKTKRRAYPAVKWDLEGHDPADIEWQDPRDFVMNTHGRDIEKVPLDAPHYHDLEKGWRPTWELADRFEEGLIVKPLEDWVDPWNVMPLPDGDVLIDGNKAHEDGRHRAWAAWSTGEQLVPVKVRGRDKHFAKKSTKSPLKERAKQSSPKFKKAVKTSLKPNELIIPSSNQEQEWAEGIYTLMTGKEPKRGKR